MGKTVVVDLQVNGKGSLAEVNEQLMIQKQVIIDIEKEITKLDDQLKKTPKNQLAAQKKLNDAIKGQREELKLERLALRELNLEREKVQSTEKAIKANKDLGQQYSVNRGFLAALNTLTGGLANQVYGFAKGISAAGKAVGNLNISLKSLKGALLATGIGALVVALGTIVAYWDDIKLAITGVSKETDTALKTQQKQTLEAKKQYDISTSQDAILKQKGMTESQILSYKKQQTAEYIKQLEAEIALNEQATTERLGTIAVIENALNRSGLNASWFGISTKETAKEGALQNEELKKTLSGLKNQFAEFENKQAEDSKNATIKRIQEREAIEKEAFKNFIEQEEAYTELFIQAASDFFKAKPEELDLSKLIYLDPEDIEVDEAMDKFIAFNKRRVAYEKETQEEIRNARYGALEDIMAITDQESALNKAAFLARQVLVLNDMRLRLMALKQSAVVALKDAAVNSATASTEVAKGSAKATATLNPVIIASYAISAAAVIASMVQAVRGVKKAAANTGASGAGPSTDAQAPAAPILPNFNIVGASPINQIGEAIAQQSQQPVKAYVVSSDVTTAQGLERNIVSSASI